MDRKTGDIYDAETAERIRKLFAAEGRQRPDWLKEMNLAPTVKQLSRKPVDAEAIGRVGRNELCPCGSGKKFKFCCLHV